MLLGPLIAAWRQLLGVPMMPCLQLRRVGGYVRYFLDATSHSSSGDGKLVEMSSDFDVLHETDLRPSEFGEGRAKYRFSMTLY
jgi:hypothetical protein